MVDLYRNFYDAGMALSDCEICLRKIENLGIGPYEFEFFYNVFITSINRAWECFYKKIDDDLAEACGVKASLNTVKELRTENCSELLFYIRNARNELLHNRRILWVSGEGEKPLGIGVSVKFRDNYYLSEPPNYSSYILPAMISNFSGSELAAIPLKGEVQVPSKHLSVEIVNSPMNIMSLSYEFYGQKIRDIFLRLN